MKIYQFGDISVEIAGVVQSLVQSVTVNSDRGLDFVTLSNQATQDVIRKGQTVTIQINYIGDGTFYNPTSAPLCNSLGDILIHRLNDDDSEGVDAQTILFKNCILMGTSSSIDASSSYYGNFSATYQSQYYLTDTAGISRPSPATGDIGGRVCYTELETNQISYSSSCSISRKYLYEPARVNPTHLCIEYPIITTSTVGVIMADGTVPKGTGKQSKCDGSPGGDSNAGFPSGSLEGVDIEGGTAGSSDFQIFNFNYKSTNNYGLNRIISLPD